MLRLTCMITALCVSLFSTAQYKNDNVSFRTVYGQDLCRELNAHPGYLLLDVRSAGEFNDSSPSTALNIGHLKTAMNMDISDVPRRMNEIANYKNKPVFVYCSHSQRSRRVSKMLADSGFTQIFNVNGGLTGLYLLEGAQKDCLSSLITSAKDYNVISPAELCTKLSAGSSKVFLLDVRPDSAWERMSLSSRANAVGYLKGAQHIALSNLKTHLAKIPMGSELVVTDLFGGDAAQAARLLHDNGFGQVSILLEGMDRWQASDHKTLVCQENLFVPGASYTILSSMDFARFYPAEKNILLLDVRPEEEFSNRHRDSYRNIGHLKNALAVPSSQLSARLSELEKYKSRPVVVYAFSSGSNEAYDAANLLVQNGFTNVKVLSGGLFNLRWTAANIPGMEQIKNWVTDVPDENK